MNADINSRGRDVSARSSRLCAINYDLSDCPDLFPVASALCAVAEGESRLTGLSRLKFKESNRVEAMTEGLTRMGAEVKLRMGSIYHSSKSNGLLNMVFNHPRLIFRLY